MNLFWLAYINSYLSLVPVLLGVIKYKESLSLYHPFILFVFLSSFSDILSYNLIIINKSEIAIAVSNIYTLLSSCLLISFFVKIKSLKNKTLIILSYVLLSSIWLLDNKLLHTIFETTSLFRVTYSIILVLLSIETLNKNIVSIRTNIKTEPTFIISIFFIINFTYRAVFESLFLFKLKINDNIYLFTFLGFVFLTFLSHIIFSISILCIQAKRRFTLSY